MVTLVGERKRLPPSGYQSARAFPDSMVYHNISIPLLSFKQISEYDDLRLAKA